MLVLSRNVDESIMIGNEIEVLLVHAFHGWARMGINAPANVKIERREIWDAGRSTSLHGRVRANKPNETDGQWFHRMAASGSATSVGWETGRCTVSITTGGVYTVGVAVTYDLAVASCRESHTRALIQNKKQV